MDHIKDILAKNGWMFVWAICALSLFFALHDTKEGIEKIKNSNGRAKAFAISRFILFWAIPILSCIGAIGTQIASDRADQKISKLNPLNQPISAMTAVVKLIVRETNTLDVPLSFNPTGLGWVCKLMFSTVSPGITEINSTHLCPLNGQIEGPVGKGAGTRIYLLRFQMDPLNASFGLGTGYTIKTMDDLNAVWMQELFLPDGVEVIEGSVTLTINSSSRKVFPIPSQRVGHPFALEITSIEKNGVWVPYEPQ